jgi:hypothetical protein
MRSPVSKRPTLLALLSALALALFALPAQPLGETAASAQPRREDRGDLIVLHLYGSYYDMGRQEAELLGPVARRMYEYHRARYVHSLAGSGLRMKLFDLGMSLMAWVGPLYEESGFFDEMNGIADGLRVPRADLLRAVTATSFGSTVFAATRSATADGGAIIGRNVDWDDGDGTMRPVVMHFHPNNGDLAYIIAGWPLIGAPAIGINAAGLALSFNFFIVDETIGLPPQMRDRRALQTATTVEQGLRVFTNVRRRAMPTFMVMADATGDIAMIECTPSAYAIFRPEGDWFAQSNHARTPEMIPFDRYRSEDSFQRRAAMEAAVRPHLGSITPDIAAQILRDRSNSPYVNDSTVANLSVLNAAVIQPAAKTLWHSTTMQPEAPFGEMVPFSVAAGVPLTHTLPADPRLGTAAMQHEAAVVQQMRQAARAFNAGKFVEAQRIWDDLARRGESILNPARLAYGRAAARIQRNQLTGADALLATIDPEHAPFDVALASAVDRGVIADRLGRRADAIGLYRQAAAYADAHPEYTDRFVAEMRAVITAGLSHPLDRGPFPETPALQAVPE